LNEIGSTVKFIRAIFHIIPPVYPPIPEAIPVLMEVVSVKSEGSHDDGDETRIKHTIPRIEPVRCEDGNDRRELLGKRVHGGCVAKRKVEKGKG
jgi:hypothetical protein